MVDPELMCRNHLLGEHLELHILAGCLNRGKNIRGFIEQGLVDPTLICKRHAELVTEMERRGYSHSSPLPELPARLERGCVRPEENLVELGNRCRHCRQIIDARRL